MNADTLSIGEKVSLVQDWSPRRNRKLRFHSGTVGEVEQLSGDGTVQVSLSFPHSPSMVENIPISVLKHHT